jgi:hypothetical protein
MDVDMPEQPVAALREAEIFERENGCCHGGAARAYRASGQEWNRKAVGRLSTQDSVHSSHPGQKRVQDLQRRPCP